MAHDAARDFAGEHCHGGVGGAPAAMVQGGEDGLQVVHARAGVRGYFIFFLRRRGKW